VLARPDGRRQDLSYDALGGDAFGVTIDELAQRGVYQISAFESHSPQDGSVGRISNPSYEARSRWPAPIVIAANGPAVESQLGSVGRPMLEESFGKLTNFRWVGPTDEISIEGAAVEGQRLWWWLAVTLSACLGMEMLILGWSGLSGAGGSRTRPQAPMRTRPQPPAAVGRISNPSYGENPERAA
jgi:hypothetical protein